MDTPTNQPTEDEPSPSPSQGPVPKPNQNESKLLELGQMMLDMKDEMLRLQHKNSCKINRVQDMLTGLSNTVKANEEAVKEVASKAAKAPIYMQKIQRPGTTNSTQKEEGGGSLTPRSPSSPNSVPPKSPQSPNSLPAMSPPPLSPNSLPPKSPPPRPRSLPPMSPPPSPNSMAPKTPRSPHSLPPMSPPQSCNSMPPMSPPHSRRSGPPMDYPPMSPRSYHASYNRSYSMADPRRMPRNRRPDPANANILTAALRLVNELGFDDLRNLSHHLNVHLSDYEPRR